MADLSLTAVEKHFDGVPALHSITTRIEDGEFVALLGPSGCGKSTLLRLLAGFETPSLGRISIGEQEVANGDTGHTIPPEARNIGFVFQSYALWPHMTVRRNVSYPLEVRGLPRQARSEQTNLALEATGLSEFADRMPSDLSGGQRQRVALARCLVSDPQAVLLDEPLANLDVALRAAMQDVFLDFHARTQATMVYVTHDQAEAMAMADRIAVLERGRIAQFDTPQELYARPRSRFVAGFVGEGTVLPIDQIRQEGDNLMAQFNQTTVAISSDSAQPNHICLRPENISLSETGDMRCVVQRCTYLGGHYRLTLQGPNAENLIAESRFYHKTGEQLGLSLHQPWAFQEI
ncbi:ABC transporter ATP-binding protein [Phaeobacter sp. C3_T13_0]|uniref:ABC transporter ATP-binding protein n=1 Tax=Phaeobacter cretensis TaxID=3342641 RepID=UPI0039BC591F